MPHKGFTLIEILIVLVIIAIVSGIAVLNIGAPTYAAFTAKADKIATTLELLNDDAAYTDSVIVCKVLAQGFSCQSYKNNEWNDLPMSRIVPWGWPKDITINQILVDGVPLKEDGTIRFIPIGDADPMSFRITDGRYYTWIDGDLDGNFQVSN